jgi:hypothetical protein
MFLALILFKPLLYLSIKFVHETGAITKIVKETNEIMVHVRGHKQQ